MLYLTKEELQIKGYYEEPIYDEHPYLGTYLSDKSIHLPVYTVIDVGDNGKVLWFQDMENFSFGVSVHPGTFTITTKMTEEDFSYLVLISDAQCDEICDYGNRIKASVMVIRELKRKLHAMEYDVKLLFEECAVESAELSEGEYEKVSDELFCLMKETARMEWKLIHENHCLSKLRDRYEKFLNCITKNNNVEQR